MERIVVEDAALEPQLQHQPHGRCLSCFKCSCNCTYRIPTIRELLQHDKRLLRSIALIVILLNVPIGKYVLYPFLLFSTWIHELFHGLAALSVGGTISWLNIYPDGSGLAFSTIPNGLIQRAWVAGAGYQGTAIVGGIMLMFRRSPFAARIGTCSIGLGILLTCVLFIRNAFGLVAMISIGASLLIAGSGRFLSSFWISELYSLVAATTCLNAVTSIRVLFIVTESNIGGVVRASDATTMQEVTKIHYWVWSVLWLALACLMSVLGVLLVFETNEDEPSPKNPKEDSQEDCPLTNLELT